jgi:hypothetical protein
MSENFLRHSSLPFVIKVESGNRFEDPTTSRHSTGAGGGIILAHEQGKKTVAHALSGQ